MPAGDPGRQIASLREILSLVRTLSGEDAPQDRDALLDEAARASAAYERSSPVTRRRFDALSAETAAWAASGVEALLAAGDSPPTGPARRLAAALDDGLVRLTGLLKL